MNDVMRITDSSISMTSREIAELVESRHSDVKRSIDRLMEKGIIQSAPLANFKNINNVEGQEYVFSGEQGKRDSIIVVAQLSPEFTARLVDRWRELESSQMSIPKSFSEALILAGKIQAEKEQLLIENSLKQQKIEEDQPKVDFYEHVTTSDKWVDMKGAAKMLNFVDIGRNRLFDLLRKGDVLDDDNDPYQTYVDRGYFKTVPVPFGKDQVGKKTVVSYKGVDWLRKNLTKNGYKPHSEFFKEAA